MKVYSVTTRTECTSSSCHGRPTSKTLMSGPSRYSGLYHCLSCSSHEITNHKTLITLYFWMWVGQNITQFNFWSTYSSSKQATWDRIYRTEYVTVHFSFQEVKQLTVHCAMREPLQRHCSLLPRRACRDYHQIQSPTGVCLYSGGL